LKAFYDFDFKIFLAELKKQKIEIELKKQNEWLPFFNQYKGEINKLQSTIQSVDSEINKLIYQWYNLSANEIQYIETF